MDRQYSGAYNKTVWQEIAKADMLPELTALSIDAFNDRHCRPSDF